MRQAVSGLSRKALWLLVGDSLAYSLLHHARALGDPGRGIGAALAILRVPGTPLTTRKTRFDWVALPDAPQVGDWLRVRGGCCRAYTRPKSAYCTTCVLRDDASRTERYRDYLRRTWIGAAA